MFRTQPRALPPDQHGTSLDWVSYFNLNTLEQPLPWNDAYRLTPEERARAGASIQQFQLGESSEGRGLLRRAREHGVATGDAQFPEAVALFIQEEQRHSRILGRFLDMHGIPRLQHDSVDTVFRRVRALAGLELCMRVLATAEIIAVPYYTALGKATASPLLGRICANILVDETAHLQFQAFVFARLSKGRPPWRQRLVEALHALFLRITMMVVWLQHGKVFRAAGTDLDGFARRSQESLRGVCSAMERAGGSSGAAAAGGRRTTVHLGPKAAKVAVQPEPGPVSTNGAAASRP